MKKLKKVADPNVTVEKMPTGRGRYFYSAYTVWYNDPELGENIAIGSAYTTERGGRWRILYRHDELAVSVWEGGSTATLHEAATEISDVYKHVKTVLLLRS